MTEYTALIVITAFLILNTIINAHTMEVRLYGQPDEKVIGTWIGFLIVRLPLAYALMVLWKGH